MKPELERDQKKLDKNLLQAAVAIYQAGVRAALPGPAVARALAPVEIQKGGRVFLLAVGKAAIPMARAALPCVRKKLAGGLVVTHERAKRKLGPCAVIRGGHPLPNRASLRAGRAALAMAGRAGKRDLFLVLLSGGASALMAVPIPGLTLRAKIRRTRALLRSGASIHQVNGVRKTLSLIKGGKLALAALPARVLTLALSDVPGDDPAVIGSGPTWLGTPRRRGEGKIQYKIIASNSLALKGAAREARRRGYRVRIRQALVQGEARPAAKKLARFCRQLPAASCLLSGGETTVRVSGKGRGGRNQEMALAAAMALEGKTGVAFLAGGTDGRDGPCPAAGAAVTGQLASLAREKGLDPGTFLRDNDAFGFFRRARGRGWPLVHLPEKATGTNVMDLYLGIAAKQSSPVMRGGGGKP